MDNSINYLKYNEKSIYSDVDVDFNVDYDSDFYIIKDIDFSEFKGKSFKTSLQKVNKAYSKGKLKTKRKDIVLKNPKTVWRNDRKQTGNISIPSNHKVIIEGVDKLILGEDKCGVKKIGYYGCEKLNELVFTISNDSAVDFEFELFNPSMPLDYLHSTSGSLNNKIKVAGDNNISYTDVLFNICANPIHIVNSKLTFAGANFQKQKQEVMLFINKKITGHQHIDPFQIELRVDNMQVAEDIVHFNLESLNRPFIPNGMDIIKYKVLAGNTVRFAFFYRASDTRKLFFEEAKHNKKLL